jgi:hypothetical protein
MSEDYNIIIEIILALTSLVVAGTMFIGVWGIVSNRLKTGKGIGLRIIQFSVVVMTVPAIIILGIHNKLEAATLGTLLGALIGYVLANLGKDEKDSQSKKDIK